MKRGMSPIFAVMFAAVAFALASNAGATDAAPPTQVAAKASPKPSRVVDRLELDSTAITGNRELPKVMSIVPWKAAEPPTGPDRPMGSLVEELLAPLDRDEFRREITYFSDLSSHSSDRPTSGAVKP